MVEVFNIGLRFGKYELLRKLAEGGMGTLFIARDTSLDRELVIKFLLPEHANNSQVVQRFLQEGRSLAKIVHPGIVTVYETGEVQGTRTHADGCAYIIMEYLQGETLAQRLRRVGRLTVSVAMEVCRQVANALQAAHEQGIIHRDLKPDNIMLVRDAALSLGERAKVLDFGIAKIAKSAAGSENATQAGLVFGTPIYMSPEQAKSTASAGAASDVYSLGCILFELLVGRPPFDGSMAELIAHHILTPPPVPSALAPGIPPHLDQVIGAMMAKNPEERPASMKVVEAILEEKRVVASMSRRRTLGGAKLITQPPPVAGAQPSPVAALAAAGAPVVANVRTPPMGVPQQHAAAPHALPSNHATMAAPMPVPGAMPLMPSPASMAASNARTAAPDPSLLAAMAAPSPTAPAQWPQASAPQQIATPMVGTAPAQPDVIKPSYPTTLSALAGTTTPAPAKKGGKGLFIGLALALVAGGAIAVAAVSGGGDDDVQPAASSGSDTVAKPETKPTETKSVETKPTETKSVETKPVETKPAETKTITITSTPTETKPTETKPTETKPTETKTVTITSTPDDSKTTTKPTETKPTETKTVTITSTPTTTAKPVDTKPVDTKPVDTKPIDTKPVDTKPADTKTTTTTTRPVDTKPVDTKTTTKPVDTKTTTKPVDTKTTTKPVDTKTTTKPVDTKPADTTKPKCQGAHCEFDGKF